MRRLIVVGDCHGTWVELRKLLAKVEADPIKDDIYCTGDAFDRAGPDCAMKVYEAFKDYNIKYIYGNHDAELAYKVKNNLQINKPWYKDWWNSYNQEAKDWFLQTEQYYYFDCTHKALLVHAGVDPVIPIEKTDPRTLCTIQCINPRGMGKPYERMKKDGVNVAYYWTNWLTDDLNNNYKDMSIVFGHTVHWPENHESRYRRFDKINVSIFNNDWGAVHGG